MTTVLCVLTWIASLSESNKSTMLCLLAFVAMLSSCVSCGSS